MICFLIPQNRLIKRGLKPLFPLRPKCLIQHSCGNRFICAQNCRQVRTLRPLPYVSHQFHNHMNVVRHDDIFINPHIGISLLQRKKLLLCDLSGIRQPDGCRGGSKPPPYSGQADRFICGTNGHIVVSRQTVIILLQPGMFPFRLHRISSAKLTPGVSSSTLRSSATVAAISQKPTLVPRLTGLTFGPATIRGTYSRVWSVVAV